MYCIPTASVLQGLFRCGGLGNIFERLNKFLACGYGKITCCVLMHRRNKFFAGDQFSLMCLHYAG